MNNSLFPKLINCYRVPILPNITYTEHNQRNYHDYLRIFSETHINILNNMCPVYSSIVNVLTSGCQPIQNANVLSSRTPKVIIKEDDKKEGVKPTRHHVTKSEVKKEYEDKAIRAFQKLYKQVVTCYLCNKKVKKIKTFAYQINYFVCTECVVSNYISKSYLIDWNYEGDIECHKCKKKDL